MKKNLLLANKYWAIEPTALEELYAISAEPNLPLEHTYSASIRGKTAIIPIQGVITARNDFLTRMFGGSPLSVLARDLHSALSNPAVENIVLDIDSPGGVAIGPAEMAEMIHEAAKHKPIIAYVGRNCCSAAYWLAAACSRIVAHSTAIVGSIGIIAPVSVQETPDMDGRRTFDIVSASAKNKHPDPRTEEGLAVLRGELNAIENQFIEALAGYRKLSPDTVRADFGQGGCFVGTEALSRKMVDEIGSFEALMNSLTPKRKEGKMETETRAETPINAEAIRAEAFAEGVKAENARLLAIEELALAGYENEVKAAKADPSMTAEKLAVKILALEKAKGGELIKALKDNESALPKVEASAPEVKPQPKSFEEQVKAEWDGSEKLRAEFGTLETYQAYREADNKGLVKVLTRNNKEE